MKVQNPFYSGAVLLGLALALSSCSSNHSPSIPRSIPTATPAPAATVYTQIERLSRPAVKEVFERFVDHQISNATEPYDPVNDPLQGEIQTFEDTVRPPASGSNVDYGKTLASVLYPDEYAVDLSQTSQSFLGYEIATATKAGSNFGGRNPNEDVIGTELSVLFGNALSALGILPDDGEENNCLSKQNIAQNPTQKTSSTFPYFAPPH